MTPSIRAAMEQASGMAAAMGLTIGAEVDVDAGRTVEITEGDEEAC